MNLPFYEHHGWPVDSNHEGVRVIPSCLVKKKYADGNCYPHEPTGNLSRYTPAVKVIIDNIK